MWLAKHKSDPSPAPWLTDEGLPDQIKAKFLSHKARLGRTPDRANGAFGEVAGRDGWIEEVIKNDDGAFLKLYGNHYLFKGQIPESAVHGMDMPKTILFQILPKLPLLTAIGLILDFLFRRKRFWMFVDWLAEQINHRFLRHHDKGEYNLFAREVSKTLVTAVYKVWGVDLTRPYYTPESPYFSQDRELPDPLHNTGKNKLAYIFARLFKFFIFFLQNDTGYRFRVQDALGERPKNLTEFLDIVISRETKFGVGYKWKFIAKAVRGIMILEPKLKRFTDAFFELADTEKLKMDEADWYYCLMYKSYDFGGLPLEERKVIWDRLNQEKKNVFLFHLPELD